MAEQEEFLKKLKERGQARKESWQEKLQRGERVPGNVSYQIFWCIFLLILGLLIGLLILVDFVTTDTLRTGKHEGLLNTFLYVVLPAMSAVSYIASHYLLQRFIRPGIQLTLEAVELSGRRGRKRRIAYSDITAVSLWIEQKVIVKGEVQWRLNICRKTESGKKAKWEGIFWGNAEPVQALGEELARRVNLTEHDSGTEKDGVNWESWYQPGVEYPALNLWA